MVTGEAATEGEPPQVGAMSMEDLPVGNDADDIDIADVPTLVVGAALEDQVESAELLRIEREDESEPAAATPNAPYAAPPPVQAYSDIYPYETPRSPWRRIALLAAGAAVLLGVGVGGVALRRRRRR